MMRCAAILFAFCASAAAAQNVTSGNGALLRGLDKVNGQTTDIEILSGGGRAVFGLEVDLADCRFPAGNPTGEAFAFLTIRTATSAEVLFQGWMVASSPALSALDHSRYDIWVLRCIRS